MRRAVEEHSNKHKVSLSDEIIDLDTQSESSNEGNKYIICLICIFA